MHDFDAVWLDVGGVLVLPDPTVLAPLLAPYGGTTDIDRHRRAHYAAMAVKSHAGDGEHDWDSYDLAYVRSVGVGSASIDVAARLLNACRVSDLWRWPIPDSVAAVQKLHGAGIPLAIVSNAAGQAAGMLQRVGICQVGEGPCVPVRCVIDSHEVGVAKPDPAIFEFAAAHFDGIDRSRTIYVGDSVTMDIRGAEAAGLRPVLLDPFDDHRDAPFERIASLADLLAP